MPNHLRRPLAHTPPPWVPDGSPFFVTLCAADRGGSPLLATGVPDALLAVARRYHEEGRWHVRLVLIMPDHLHALMALPRDENLTTLVGSWKRFVGTRFPVRWQRGYFDHRLRSPQEHDLKLDYIRLNPVRAGLVTTPDAWPWQWQPDDCSITTSPKLG